MPYISDNGIKIHYEIEGKRDTPAIVMQHGLTSSLEMWRESGYVAALTNDYRLVLVDARGHGLSDKPHDPVFYRPWAFARDIVMILDTLGIKKAGYWGYSMGASIGFNGIVRYALSRFNFLILGGMSPYRTEVESREGEPRFIDMRMAAEQGMEAYISHVEKRDSIKYHPDYRARVLTNDPVALYAIIRSMATWLGAEDILAKIKVPCLLYAGEEDGFCSGARRAASEMPDARFVSFPGLNHMQTSRGSDVVLPHVKKFLAEVNQKQEARRCLL